MKLYSKIYGYKAQDLIIIHGLFGMSDNWNALGKKFYKYCKVHLIDLRNHGRSPHAEEFDYKVKMNTNLFPHIIEFKTRYAVPFGDYGKLMINR